MEISLNIVNHWLFGCIALITLIIMESLGNRTGLNCLNWHRRTKRHHSYELCHIVICMYGPSAMKLLFTSNFHEMSVVFFPFPFPLSLCLLLSDYSCWVFVLFLPYTWSILFVTNMNFVLEHGARLKYIMFMSLWWCF